MSRPSRTEQAAQLFGQVVDAILSGDFGLVAVLRTCSHACGLASWTEAQQWFQRELEGYGADVQLPEFRRGLPGTKSWQAASAYDVPAYVAHRSVYGEKESPEAVSLDFRGTVADALRWAEKGVAFPTDQMREREGAKGWREVLSITYSPSGFRRVAQAVENHTFNFASRACTLLTYGDALADIWDGYRAVVEPVLSELGLEKNLEAIRDGVASDNPEQWRNAMFGCRNVLVDLASYLWPDGNPVYQPLSGKTKEFRVDAAHYVNRLAAYLHLKGVTGASGAYIRAELERIVSSLHTLNDLGSKGHAPVTREDA